MYIEKVQPTRAFVIVLCLGIFFEVILSIFLLNSQLFLSLNLWELIGIGLGISIPILAYGTFCFGIFYDFQTADDEEDSLMELTLGSFSSIVVFTIWLLFSFYNSFTIRNFYFTFFLADVVGVLLLLAFIKVLLRRLIGDAINKNLETIKDSKEAVKLD